MPADPCLPAEVAADDGARLQGCAHGGHLTGWWPVGASTSRLWMSAASTCGPGAAIRGGIPVVFPQFSSLGDLPKHGFARTQDWERLDAEDARDGVLAFATTIGPRPGWPHRARLTLSASARSDTLTVEMSVANSGSTPFAFTAALHSYLGVSSTTAARVHGLSGWAARDAIAGGRPLTLAEAPLSPVGPLDLMVPDVPGPLTLHDDAHGDLTISATGFRDWVVWNPGEGHGLGDVRAGDEARFVCIEPAALAPVAVAPGHQWAASLTLRASDGARAETVPRQPEAS